MEVSTEKSKIMTTSTNNISAKFSMKDQKLEEVTSLKYLHGSNPVQKGTCAAEIRGRIA